MALALLAATGCADPPAGPSRRAAPELVWYRDFAIERAGGDVPVMHVDPDGGLWAAVPGASDRDGRARLFHRPRGGAWRQVSSRPFATELSLSSVRGGEVFFGFNQPFDQYR